jgi:hypothetical protein
VVDGRRESELPSMIGRPFPIYPSQISYINSSGIFLLLVFVPLPTICCRIALKYQNLRLNVTIANILFGVMIMGKWELPTASLLIIGRCLDFFQRFLIYNPIKGPRFVVCDLFGTDKNEITL